MTASNSAVTSTGRARRRWIIAIGVLVFIVVVFHLAGGWYFAGILETDALIPQAPSRDFGVIANIDFGRVVKEEASRKALVGPIMLPASLTAVAMTIADVRFDIGWEDINYVQRAADIDIPVLVFQGSADDTVPPSVAADLEAANPDRVTLVVTGADHMKSWNENPERYETTLTEFLARVT